MTPVDRDELLRLLDHERMTDNPGAHRIAEMGVVREVSEGGKSCEIVYSSCTETEVDAVIQHQIQSARSAGYELEWKVYGHDQPHCLGERLTAAGFEAGDTEAFMAFRADDESMERFAGSGAAASPPSPTSGGADIKQLRTRQDLEDYRKIREEGAGSSCADEVERYASILENDPKSMSLYAAYVDGEPAACGRIYFVERSGFAYLYGGNTRERFRRRGLFTQVVAARIHEAQSRGIANIFVDALPTSEPILSKRGFEILTHTQPFFFSG
jgi:hypothetical protein